VAELEGWRCVGKLRLFDTRYEEMRLSGVLVGARAEFGWERTPLGVEPVCVKVKGEVDVE